MHARPRSRAHRHIYTDGQADRQTHARVHTHPPHLAAPYRMHPLQEEKRFTFDYCYGEDSTQSTIFADLGVPILEKALGGFNGTIFAYGQTGGGCTLAFGLVG